MVQNNGKNEAISVHREGSFTNDRCVDMIATHDTPVMVLTPPLAPP